MGVLRFIRTDCLMPGKDHSRRDEQANHQTKKPNLPNRLGSIFFHRQRASVEVWQSLLHCWSESAYSASGSNGVSLNETCFASVLIVRLRSTWTASIRLCSAILNQTN